MRRCDMTESNVDALASAMRAVMNEGSGSGPGRSYRKGISLIELFEMFPDNSAAQKWFEKVIWKDGRVCPYCLHPETKRTDYKPSIPYRCMRCHRHFSVKVGTVMHRSKLGYQKWAIAVYMFATSIKGVSSMKLHRDLKITQKSAWFMGQRLREAWKSIANKSGMAGPVEIDETYIGGLEKNKHKDKKGKSKKVAVVGIKDRATGHITAKPVPETTKARLEHFVEGHVDDAAIKYTDDNPAYGGLTNHETVNHSTGEYVRGQVHTNGIESFWALMERGYVGIYHKMSAEHLHRYVNEFSGRHNIRPMDTIDMMCDVAAHMKDKRLTYKGLIQYGTRATRIRDASVRGDIQ